MIIEPRKDWLRGGGGGRRRGGGRGGGRCRRGGCRCSGGHAGFLVAGTTGKKNQENFEKSENRKIMKMLRQIDKTVDF